MLMPRKITFVLQIVLAKTKEIISVLHYKNVEFLPVKMNFCYSTNSHSNISLLHPLSLLRMWWHYVIGFMIAAYSSVSCMRCDGSEKENSRWHSLYKLTIEVAIFFQFVSDTFSSHVYMSKISQYALVKSCG